MAAFIQEVKYDVIFAHDTIGSFAKTAWGAWSAPLPVLSDFSNGPWKQQYSTWRFAVYKTFWGKQIYIVWNRIRNTWKRERNLNGVSVCNTKLHPWERFRDDDTFFGLLVSVPVLVSLAHRVQFLNRLSYSPFVRLSVSLSVCPSVCQSLCLAVIL